MASPRTEQVLRDYIASQTSRGASFFISPKLNSKNMGQFGDLFSAIAQVAATVTGQPEIAAAAGSLKAAAGGAAGPAAITQTADQIAAQILPQVQTALAEKGIVLPPTAAQSTVTASILDAFGAQNTPFVELGLGLLGLFLAFKVIRAL